MILRFAVSLFVSLNCASVGAFMTTVSQRIAASKSMQQRSTLADDEAGAGSASDSSICIEDVPTSSSTTFSTQQLVKSTRRIAVIMCPAQFCVPADYTSFFSDLQQLELGILGSSDDSSSVPTELIELSPLSRTVPLSRTDWIKVARQLPTRAYFDAQLSVPQTLSWYFQAIDDAAMAILNEDPDVSLCFVGHSIGGWVARAYLGGMAASSSAVYQMAVERCTSLITLGTPHTSPPEALVDQTRGLLKAIELTSACSPEALLKDRGIRLTCVASGDLKGRFASFNVEEFVAASSYLPLIGKVGDNVEGDGIVPLELAFLDEPARRVKLSKCSVSGEPIRHLHVLPTPWNLWNGDAGSIPLNKEGVEFPSYISPGVIPQWARYIQ